MPSSIPGPVVWLFLMHGLSFSKLEHPIFLFPSFSIPFLFQILSQPINLNPNHGTTPANPRFPSTFSS